MLGGSGRESKTAERERRERLAAARKNDDVVGTLAAVDELLRSWWPGVRAQTAKALRPWYAQDDDVDDVAVATMMRLLSALGNERDLAVPIAGLVARSVDYEVRDFRRGIAEQAAHEELRAPEEMPELPAAETPGPLEQADGLRTLLVRLSARERQIVIEREVLDLAVAVVAERQRMSPAAVRQVCSRALARLRRAAEEANRGDQ